jgi:hypothetical protein
MTFPDTGASPVQIALPGGALDSVRAWRRSTCRGAAHPGAGRPGGAVRLTEAAAGQRPRPPQAWSRGRRDAPAWNQWRLVQRSPVLCIMMPHAGWLVASPSTLGAGLAYRAGLL